MIAHVVLEVVLVLGDELAQLAGERSFRTQVHSDVRPVVGLDFGVEFAVFAAVDSRLFRHFVWCVYVCVCV